MNLSTARSSLRAREIGIRKVVGAQKKELITQFLSESVLFCWISTLLALGLAFLMLPWISRVTGQELSLAWVLHPGVILLILATPFVLGLLAGVYPAMFLSSFQPVKTLKGLFKAAGSNISFRKVLVVSQFSISIILIITTIIVFQQLKYIQSKSLGYDRDKVITMGVSNEMVENMDAFRTEMINSSTVKTMSRSSRVPTGRLLDNNGAATQSGDSMRPVTIDIKYIFTDYDFADTYGLQMASGRYFSRDFGNDSASFVLNEKAIAALGWKVDDAIGRPFQYGGRKGQVIGVVKDFHFESLHQDIIPMVFWMPLRNQGGGRLSIKVAGNDIRSSLASLEAGWKKHFPSTPFEYTFVDENYQRLYEAETRQASLFSFFSAVAILIACLGLFGLSAFSISQRIKEIGVRKVLGASVRQIVVLLSTDFLKLVLLAALIAFPLAWVAMNNWLDNFAYRIGIPWWVFIVAAILAALIALLTISYLAIRAALSNPVKSLRTE
jgi:putative ABC transport system permease protein